MPLTSSFLSRYRADRTAAPRTERVLAAARAFLTVSALVAIYLDATEPARLAALTYSVLAAYALYSLVLVVIVHRAIRIAPWHGLLIHGLDILWSSALTFVSEGPVSPFFLFFLFAVLAAAYRWGFRATMTTAVVVAVVFLLENAVTVYGPWEHIWLPLELNRTILRVTYLLMTGFLLGYLAEQEKHSRAELAAIASAARPPRVDLGLGGSVAGVAEALLQTFRADAVAIVLRESESGQTLLWRFDGRTSAESATSVRLELDLAEQTQWLFAAPGRAWHAVLGGGEPALLRATEPGVWPLKRLHLRLPPVVTDARPAAATITAVTVGLTGEWTGRIYLFDSRAIEGLERGLHFLEALADHVAPGLTNVLLLRRLRSQVSAAERARVARELHDGAIQSLFGIEMKVDVLRRQAASAAGDRLESQLGEIQDLLRREVLAMRELMQALKPIEIDGSHQLPDVLASVVERFRRDTGVSARFVTTGGAPPLPPATALEIVRIVQEALVNVRRHSRARNVLVRLTHDRDALNLVVEDDGRGFEFEGRLSLAELDRRRVGPAIIKERARMAGADLAIESRPGVGARIELKLAGVVAH